MKLPEPCLHSTLQLDCSAFAEAAGFVRPHALKRWAAKTASSRLPPKSEHRAIEQEAKVLARTFPAPLVLPWDDLNLDPESPEQSFKSWLHGKTRNQVTQKSKTIYVAAVPEITEDVGFMQGWTRPVSSAKGAPPSKKARVQNENEREFKSPEIRGFVEYLRAFFHGMLVKELPQRLRFVSWVEKPTPSKSESRTNDGLPVAYVGLACNEAATRIRVRPSPDGAFTYQLNLNDILDKVIEILPDDAYAILLLVDHDMYESEEDDFCCGRAYGGSRIAVVQTARYNPLLDEAEGTGDKIDQQHVWPMSHCREYTTALCALEGIESGEFSRRSSTELSNNSGAIQAAIAAVSTIDLCTSPEASRNVWFSRLCRTVSHELGHCLGIGHCVYYACNMQGTAGMAEDVRQPPYLCPVCLEKVSFAIAVEFQKAGDVEKGEWVHNRYKALEQFCVAKVEETGTGMWKSLEAWLKVVTK